MIQMLDDGGWVPEFYLTVWTTNVPPCRGHGREVERRRNQGCWGARRGRGGGSVSACASKRGAMQRKVTSPPSLPPLNFLANLKSCMSDSTPLDPLLPIVNLFRRLDDLVPVRIHVISSFCYTTNHSCRLLQIFLFRVHSKTVPNSYQLCVPQGMPTLKSVGR